MFGKRLARRGGVGSCYVTPSGKFNVTYNMLHIYCLFRTVTVFLLNERNLDIAAAALTADDAEEPEFVRPVTDIQR